MLIKPKNFVNDLLHRALGIHILLCAKSLMIKVRWQEKGVMIYNCFYLYLCVLQLLSVDLLSSISVISL